MTIRKESEIIVPEIAKEKEIGDVEVTPETSDIVDSKVDNTRVIITLEGTHSLFMFMNYSNTD